MNTHRTHARGRRNSGRSGPADTVPIRFGLWMKILTNVSSLTKAAPRTVSCGVGAGDHHHSRRNLQNVIGIIDSCIVSHYPNPRFQVRSLVHWPSHATHLHFLGKVAREWRTARPPEKQRSVSHQQNYGNGFVEVKGN